jgi:protein involved in polysaccharide export with SLBB domain
LRFPGNFQALFSMKKLTIKCAFAEIPFFKDHSIKRYLLFLTLFLFLADFAQGQSMDDLSNVKVEELTNEQIRRFVVEVDRMGVTDQQMEDFALQRGMSPIELAKLKDRMQAMRKAMASGKTNQPGRSPVQNQPADSIAALEQKPLTDFNVIFSELKAKNFGAEVFNNPRLTFEPNLRLPTPKNYQLAADDELLIDVSGYSEANYKLKISPEGVIRIPVAGSVSVSGLTIEQAKKIIVKRLANTLYSDINSGHTFVEVYLGQIRSMKITIIGEATLPGTFTLPSLATAYNALYACGGPNTNGSFRNIQVIRNNTPVATIDVYQYLLNGNKKSDVRLMDQDIIKINSYDIRVELKGEVKKPGLYDVLPGESLGQVLQYAGGFTDNAYTARIQVFRNTSKDRKVSTVTDQQWLTAVPEKGDTYLIGKILNRFTNRVSIRGSIYRPGEYELKDGMTLSQLIAEADGIREDAFTGRGLIHRLKDDLSPEIISFDLEKIAGDKTLDVSLRREDRVNIFSKFDLKEGYYVSIEGEISNPGTFLYEEGVTIQDLVLMAGGLKESATSNRIEVSRRIKGQDSTSVIPKTAIIYQKDITTDLKDSAGVGKFVLLPFDEVSIRKTPGYTVQKNVVIEGEVIYAGKYTLETKTDHISDLVKRAGGLTKEAYVQGAVLVRSRNFTKAEQSNYEQGVSNLLKQNFQAGTSPVLLQNQLEVSTQKRSDLVGIDLQRILDNPNTGFDLLLNDGDTLRIPRQLQTVRVNGEVLYPALVRYENRLNFRDYISGAGGFSDRSAKKRSYVLYPNGSVQGTKSFLFFRNYPELSPGAEIYVPMKREKERLRTGEVITIGATLVSMLAILVNVLR